MLINTNTHMCREHRETGWGGRERDGFTQISIYLIMAFCISNDLFKVASVCECVYYIAHIPVFIFKLFKQLDAREDLICINHYYTYIKFQHQGIHRIDPYYLTHRYKHSHITRTSVETFSEITAFKQTVQMTVVQCM